MFIKHVVLLFCLKLNVVLLFCLKNQYCYVVLSKETCSYVLPTLQRYCKFRTPAIPFLCYLHTTMMVFCKIFIK